MKKIFFLALLFAGALFINAQTKNFIDLPYIETTAKVDTLVSPDKILLSIQIAEVDTKGKVSLEEQENKMARVLESLGIDLKKQLKISDLSSNFKKYFLRSQDILKSKSYMLEVYDGLTAGKVIQELEKAGISNVDLEQTEYTAMKELMLELKSKAVARAKKQAEAMVKPLGQKVGPAILLSDLNTYVDDIRRPLRMSVLYEAAPKAEEKPVDIDFEKIKVVSNVSVKFRLE
ncbi:MAG: SIMPL domain-containing protein [Chlorobi bacterium]|nr:SIMPL domain-containing protein [Chlorobiota bacterium]